MRDLIASAGLGKKIDRVEPNNTVILMFVVFLALVAALMIGGSGGATIGFIGGACALGTGAYFFFQKSKNWIDIYEEGIVVSGMMTRTGSFRYSEMSYYGTQGTNYGLLSIPIFNYTNLSIYGKNDRELTILCSIFYGNLEKKLAILDEKIKP